MLADCVIVLSWLALSVSLSDPIVGGATLSMQAQIQYSLISHGQSLHHACSVSITDAELAAGDHRYVPWTRPGAVLLASLGDEFRGAKYLTSVPVCLRSQRLCCICVDPAFVSVTLTSRANVRLVDWCLHTSITRQ